MSEKRLMALELFKHLPRTNCRECQAPTCLAFAALVIQKQRKLTDCPYLSGETLERFSDLIEEGNVTDLRLNEVPHILQERVGAVDFGGSLERLNAKLVDSMLAIRCLGREFRIDKQGELHTEGHANFWVHVPLLNYIHFCRGRAVAGEWVKFDQLREAVSFSNYFSARCETALKEITDGDPELFFDVLHIFGGREVEQDFSADHAVAIHPLPRVPFLICYWKPDEEFDSKFRIYFDRSADDNIDIESLYVLGMGLVYMLKKIVLLHGGTDGIEAGFTSRGSE